MAGIEARHEKRLDHAKRAFHAIHERPLHRIVGDVALGRIDHFERKQDIIVVALLPEMAVGQLGSIILEPPDCIAKHLQRPGKPRQEGAVEMHVVRHHHVAEKQNAGIQERYRLKGLFHLLAQR